MSENDSGKRVLALMASIVESAAQAPTNDAENSQDLKFDLELLKQLIAEPFSLDAALGKLVKNAHKD